MSEGGEKLTLFTLQEAIFQEALQGVKKQPFSDFTISFPDAKGRFAQYRIRETPVFAPELAAKYPDIRSFTGYSTGTTPQKIRFSYSHNGLQAMVMHSTGSDITFIEKVGKEKAVSAVKR